MPEQLSRAPWLFFSFDDQGLLLEGNEVVSQLTGIAQDQLPGRPVSQLLTKSGNFFYQTHLFPTLQLALRADEVFLLFRKQSGESFPVLVYAVRWQHQGGWINECYGAPIPRRRLLEQALIQARQEAQDTLRQNKALNDAKQTLEDQQTILDKRIRQLEQANDELRQITSIVSHDLMEPVRKVSMLADILQHHQTPVHPEHQPLVAQISTICRSAGRLITGLRNYLALDREEQAMTPVDLNEIVWQAAEQVGQEHAVNDGWLTADQLPIIPGYEAQLQSLFIQLITNSLTYRQANEPIRVTVSVDVIQENKFAALPERYQYTDHVRIKITDNGVGFSPQYKTAVFMVLKRLGTVNQTLGLGLAICKKVVSNHFGTIQADSTPGKGTTITIVIPKHPM